MVTDCTCGFVWFGHPNPHAIDCPAHDTAAIRAAMQGPITAEWARFYRLRGAGFPQLEAAALATAGYDVIGHLDTTTLHFTALTGVQG